MAPPTATEDYYNTLQVEQSATLEVITSSYRRLASQLPPHQDGYTQAIQSLTLAYETLSDEHKRREYDIMQYFIRQSRPTPQTMQTPRPSPASTPQTGAGSHGNQIGEAARTLESPRVVGMRARAVARVADARAEVAIERLRRLREAREVASIRQGYGGTPQARASVCYYEGEWEKLDGGALCPECLDVCTYQLRCPDCEAKACRRCQKEASLRFPHNTGKIARTALTKGREG